MGVAALSVSAVVTGIRTGRSHAVLGVSQESEQFAFDRVANTCGEL